MRYSASFVHRDFGCYPSATARPVAGAGIAELAVMPNVLNPEPESITLNTELETPTLDPATELEAQPSESTSNPETAESLIAAPALDADASTEPVAQAAPAETEHVAQHSAAPAEHSAESNEDFSAAL